MAKQTKPLKLAKADVVHEVKHPCGICRGKGCKSPKKAKSGDFHYEYCTNTMNVLRYIKPSNKDDRTKE